MSKLLKKKNIYIFSGAVLIIICLFIGWLRLFYVSDKWKMQISDVSKHCFSNVLDVYANKEYSVVSGVGNKIIAKGKSNYPKSVDYLVNKIKTYPIDNESMLNYKVIFKDNDEVIVDQGNSPEIKKFLDTIALDNLFWCE